jgi:hypothetical protein
MSSSGRDAIVTTPDELRARAIAALAADTLRAGLELKFRAVGTSMIPAIWPGDVLTVQPASVAFPKVGAIALTLARGSLRAHRVVEHRGTAVARSIRTRGDALSMCDPEAPSAEVLGTVVARNGRHFERGLQARGSLIEVLNRVSSYAPVRWLRLKCCALRLRASASGSSWRPSTRHRQVA